MLDCNTNIYSKHLVRVEKILVEIKGVINKLTTFLKYKEMISQKYIQIFDAIYNLSDFSQILLNPNDDINFYNIKNISNCNRISRK